MKLIFDEVPEFDRDFKHLSKKYRTLDADFGRFKKALSADGVNLRGTVRISGLGKDVTIPIYKAKKFHSDSFKGRGSQSGFRVIYAHISGSETIVFLEMYHKNSQENEDRNRIHKYFGTESTYVKRNTTSPSLPQSSFPPA